MMLWAGRVRVRSHFGSSRHFCSNLSVTAGSISALPRAADGNLHGTEGHNSAMLRVRMVGKQDPKGRKVSMVPEVSQEAAGSKAMATIEVLFTPAQAAGEY